MNDVAAIVTGDALELGNAIPKMLSAHEARFAFFDLNNEVGDAAADEIDGALFRINVAGDASAMLMGLPQAAQDSLGTRIPHPSRLGKAEEYAQLVESIVANQMLNGEVIRLDGTIRMTPH